MTEIELIDIYEVAQKFELSLNAIFSKPPATAHAGGFSSAVTFA
jgi:hypothetical protein